MCRLVLVRHGQSTANAANIFTGWADPPLSEQGAEEARAVARSLAARRLAFDAVFTSALERARVSANVIMGALGQANVRTVADPALNERHYGVLTGHNKAEAAERWGAAKIAEWRRSYAVGPPEGESLRDTAARVLPFYLGAVLPAAMRGSVLVVAHGNSLRALVMALDGLSGDEVTRLELATGATLLYELAADTTVLAKEVIR